MISTEHWVQIVSFPNYFISDKGNVFSEFSNRLLTLTLRHDGYLVVSLGKGNLYLVHRLVVENFIGAISEGYEVNHIDGDKTNNNIDNLEIVTPSENIMHSYRIGLRSKNKFKPRCVRIVQTGELFDSISSLARFLSVTPQAVDQALKRNSFVGGYKIERV